VSRISAKVIADSVSPGGKRITTLVLTYPRFIHSEVMTHRVLSRNAASSRAIPVKKMMAQVRKDPSHPVYWGKNQAGMQAREALSGLHLKAAVFVWNTARWPALFFVWLFTKIGLHKQIANRILEPWMWMQSVVTATEWENFYNLRDHEDAQPEFRALVLEMKAAVTASTPQLLSPGMWHLPFISEDEFKKSAFSIDALIRFSVARCARVSFLNHEGKIDYEKDRNLHDDLRKSGHMSPFEHVATPLEDPNERSGNLVGWLQYRKTLPNEDVFKRAVAV
jgi:hypothetical protein